MPSGLGVLQAAQCGQRHRGVESEVTVRRQKLYPTCPQHKCPHCRTRGPVGLLLCVEPCQCFLSTRRDGAAEPHYHQQQVPRVVRNQTLCSSFSTKRICWDHRSLAEAQHDSCRSTGCSRQGGRGAQQSHRTADGTWPAPQRGPGLPVPFPFSVH